jgi:RNA polymerase sigma factor for flagellar operon FliA
MSKLASVPESKKQDTAERDAELDKLWRRYKQSGDPDLKNELLMKYLGLIKSIVRRIMPKYNRYNEFDDLVSCGVIGLMDAIDKFSLDLGVKFESYAVLRIRGEILDYMRSQDWAPPSMRKKISSIARCYEEIENTPGLEDSDEYVAEKLDMSVDQVQKILAQSHMFNLMNFEDSIAASNAINSAPVSEDSLPENRLLDKELKTALVQFIDTLPEKERLVITLYYYEELLLRDIADIMGVTESRVSQIHSKVLIKMRNKLAPSY